MEGLEGAIGFGFVMLGLLLVVWLLVKWDNEDPDTKQSHYEIYYIRIKPCTCLTIPNNAVCLSNGLWGDCSSQSI